MIIAIMVNFACFLPGLDVGGLDRRSAIERVVRSRGGLNVQNNCNVYEVNAILVSIMCRFVQGGEIALVMVVDRGPIKRIG